MQTPFEILEVAEDADDDAIKKAYLKKVKDYPPERDKEAFQRIRTAFETIQTDKQRRQYRLFHVGQPNFDALLRQALKPGAVQRPEADLLVGALAESVLADLLKAPVSS
jgi:curved DNA-binding protein CbpA